MSRAEPRRRELHAPAREVLHRGHADEQREAVVQGRARQAGAAGKLVERPRSRGIRVQHAERAADVTVAEAREPTGRVVGQPVEVAARGIDEHHLARALEQRVAARAAFPRLGDGLAQHAADPVAGAPRLDVQHPRERVDQRIERLEVAADEAAHDDGVRFVPRQGRTGLDQGAAVGHRNRLRIVRGRLDPVGAGVWCTQARCARDHVCVAAREHDDVAGGEAHGRHAVGGGPAAAFRDHVVREDVVGARQHGVGDRPCRGRLRDPFVATAHVEVERAAQAHRPQDVGEGIGCAGGGRAGRSRGHGGEGRRTIDHVARTADQARSQ